MYNRESSVDNTLCSNRLVITKSDSKRQHSCTKSYLHIISAFLRSSLELSACLWPASFTSSTSDLFHKLIRLTTTVEPCESLKQSPIAGGHLINRSLSFATARL